MPDPAFKSRRLVTGLRAATILALAALAGSPAPPVHASRLSRLVNGTEAAHPNALWHIVHGLCLRDMRVSGNPAPCIEVNTQGGYAVVKDVERKTQYLLIPTARITGIEGPALLTAASPNYWQAAWTARRWMEKQLGHPVPREDLGLAVNSAFGRTQNQLHIHIDCVRPDVQAALKAQGPRFGSRWTSFRGDFGLSYKARWIDGTDLGATDPFKLVAHTDPVARADMARETLVLIGASRADGRPGFVLLAARADPADPDDAAGEELLDHRCRVLSGAGGV
jgi:CDP-diacylglycerol pyrophosphatase